MTRLYRIIYVDPPWQYRDKALDGNRGASCKYDVMTAYEISRLPVEKIADAHSVLFLWTTYPMLPDAFDIIKSWGFTYRTVAFTWIKTDSQNKWKLGMGSWTRANAEICLLATKGKPKRQDAGVSQIIKSTPKAHSQKPDIVRQKIIQLCGDLPRIELFARTKVYGWDVWGNDEKLQLEPLETFTK